MPRSATPGPVPPTNRLLAALPPREFARLWPHLETYPLAFRATLHEASTPHSHVYFPNSGLICVLSPPEGKSIGVEIGVVGREGMAGLAAFLGVDTTPSRCIVQVPGEALRMPVQEFRDRVGSNGLLHDLLLRYTHAFLAQVSLSLACNSLHSLEKRLCRWLLTVQGRTGADQFPLTHEFMAAMLGVRRAGVTETARGLRRAQLIRYARGQLTILDREGLERSACGCHRAIQAEVDRLHG